MIYASTFDINYLCLDCYKANEISFMEITMMWMGITMMMTFTTGCEQSAETERE